MVVQLRFLLQLFIALSIVCNSHSYVSTPRRLPGTINYGHSYSYRKCGNVCRTVHSNSCRVGNSCNSSARRATINTLVVPNSVQRKLQDILKTCKAKFQSLLKGGVKAYKSSNLKLLMLLSCVFVGLSTVRKPTEANAAVPVAKQQIESTSQHGKRVVSKKKARVIVELREDQPKSSLRIKASESKIAVAGGSRSSVNRVVASNSRSSTISVTDNFRTDINVVNDAVQEEMLLSWKSLSESLEGVKLDSLIMLIATSAVIPIFKRLNTSPIIGFMLTGTLLGPNGLNWVKDIHMIDVLGELGIVFFLFEMGLELSFDRLKAMRKDVFGLGSSQYLLSALAGTAIAKAAGLGTAAAVTVGGSLALSSSAFVLQLLKDGNSMGTKYGKAAFGILLLQDLAVVPLLVMVELLSKGGTGLVKALALAGAKAVVTLTWMSLAGRILLDRIFSQVARSNSNEAFLSIILTTVLFMSFVTKGIGLSDTLGAFLAGILLAETRYRYQIEADIAPFRGLLLGFFFIHIGINIDLKLVFQELPKLATMLFAMIFGKASIVTLLSLLFGSTLGTAQHCGLLTAQGGEFAFVAFGIAAEAGLISEKLSKLLLTTVALSMAATPALNHLGASISSLLEKNLGLRHYLGESTEGSSEVAVEIEEKDFVFVCGYGPVGKMICEMLDKKLIPYIVVDGSPVTAIEARNKGLPVFYGDVNRPEVLKNFNIGAAKACVVTLDDMTATNKAVVRIKKMFPNLPMIVRAKNPQHQQRLESMFDDLSAVAPVLAEDSLLLTLPFGGAVLRKIGVSTPESSTIMEDFRRKYIEVDAVQDDSEGGDFFDLFRRRLPTDAVEEEQIEQKRQDEVDKNINNAISDMIVTDSIATIKELEDDNIAEENLNEPFYALRVSEEELEEGIKQKVHPMIDYQVEKLIEQREKRKNELVVGDKSMESKLDEALEHFESSDNVSFPVVAQAPELLDDKGST